MLYRRFEVRRFMKEISYQFCNKLYFSNISIFACSFLLNFNPLMLNTTTYDSLNSEKSHLLRQNKA